MAYQPKSYRKFIVGAVSTAVVASSFAGVAGAASYSDVNSKYQEAVDFVVSKGIKGTSATTFGTYENIKRVDAAVFVASVLGLNTTSAPNAGFTDVPARAQGAVNALKAAGITSGKSATTFGAQDYITRGELAVWIQKGFDLKAGTQALKFTDVAAKYQEAVSALVSNNVTSGTSATTFGTYENAKRGDFAIFLKRAKDAQQPPKVEKPTVLKIEEADTVGNKLANGSTKLYTVTFTNPVSGKPIEDATLNVTFKENLNTNFKPQNQVWVTNGYSYTGQNVTPYQSVDGQEDEVEIKTDKFGKATFAVSGSNATVTPIVFLDGSNQYWDASAGHLPFQQYADDRFDPETEFSVEAKPLTFGITEYKITVEGLGDNYAAVAQDYDGKGGITGDEHNGREYKITVTKPDGTVYNGGVVNVGVLEKLDGKLGTVTDAYIVGTEANGTLKLGADGTAKFWLASEKVNDSAKPIVWIDQNSGANYQAGVLEDGEPVSDSAKVAPTNFQPALIDATGKLEVKDLTTTNEKEFVYSLLNQSGKVFQPSKDVKAVVTYEVVNTGSHDIEVDGQKIAVGGTATFAKEITKSSVSIKAKAGAGGNSSVKVTASASIDYLVGHESKNVAVAPVSKTANLGFTYNAVVKAEQKDTTNDGKNNPEQIILTFDKEVYGAEVTDFRIYTDAAKTVYANPATIAKDKKTLTLTFSTNALVGSTTLYYDGNFGGSSVLADQYGNSVSQFDIKVD